MNSNPPLTLVKRYSSVCLIKYSSQLKSINQFFLTQHMQGLSNKCMHILVHYVQELYLIKELKGSSKDMPNNRCLIDAES